MEILENAETYTEAIKDVVPDYARLYMEAEKPQEQKRLMLANLIRKGLGP